MKLPLLLTLGCSLIVAAEPDFSPFKVEKLPFPDLKAEARAFPLEEIEQAIAKFDGVIGSYPPRFKEAKERTTTYDAWSAVLRSATKLRASAGDTERIICALAALYRQGHNMDVTGCASHAGELIEDGLKKHPDSIPMNLQASYFYLQIDTSFASEGEKALLHLRKLLKTDRNLEVERGLCYAYLQQQKMEEAKKQIDRYLQLDPKDTMFPQIREAIEKGTVRTTTLK